MANPDLGVLEEKAILDVYRSGWLGQGKKTREFEKLLSKFFSSNAIAVNSGSSAIMCALLAHGIKPGDSVVVPNFTFMSTASVPKILGAEIIPVDIDPATLNLDVQALEEVLKNFTPNKKVPLAAQSLEDPVPYSCPAITISGTFSFIYCMATSYMGKIFLLDLSFVKPPSIPGTIWLRILIFPKVPLAITS